MPVGLLKDIIDRVPPDGPFLGLDTGRKTIGLAVSNADRTMAFPLQTIRRVKFTKDIESLREVIESYEVTGLILGYPVNMDGSQGPRCQSVRHFAEELCNYPRILGTDPWIALWDERLSTVSVEELVGNSVNINKAKQNGLIDKLAAQVILQGALDFMKQIQEP